MEWMLLTRETVALEVAEGALRGVGALMGVRFAAEAVGGGPVAVVAVAAVDASGTWWDWLSDAAGKPVSMGVGEAKMV